MPKKVLGKRGREEEKVERSVRKHMRSMLGELQGMPGTPHQMMKISEMLQQRAHDSIDNGYIKTILFPELYNADIPQPMSTQSYCRFTDKKELTFSSAGSGMLVWFPKVNSGPSLFVRTGEIDSQIPFGVGAWKMGNFQDYSPHFTQTSLVAASLSLQYIGQLQNEQGYFVASQLYGINADTLTPDDIENGQFRSMAKPGDGMRTTYLPKDMQDFTYYPCSKKAGEPIKMRNAGQKTDGETTIVPLPAYTDSGVANLADLGNIFVGGTLPPNFPTITAVANQATVYKSPQFVLTKDADYIAVYWKGLKADAGSNDLRLDCVRKFNGFPVSSQRDILDLTKPKKLFDPKKTIDVIQELQTAIPTLVSHSLKQMDRVSDQIQEFLPNIGHLYNEGMLREGTSLEGFAQQLQMVNGNEGAGTMAPGRIYDS